MNFLYKFLALFVVLFACMGIQEVKGSRFKEIKFLIHICKIKLLNKVERWRSRYPQQQQPQQIILRSPLEDIYIRQGRRGPEEVIVYRG